jgi:hypothetical protein
MTNPWEGKKMNLIIRTYAIYVSQQDYDNGIIASYGIDLTDAQLQRLNEMGYIVVLTKEETF